MRALHTLSQLCLITLRYRKRFEHIEDKMTDILQMKTSRSCTWQKIIVVQFKFNSSLLLRDQFTINQHCFRHWLGAKEAISNYLSQWCSSMLTHICITRHQCLILLHTEMSWGSIKYNDIAQITKKQSMCQTMACLPENDHIMTDGDLTTQRKESRHHQLEYGHTFPAISGLGNRKIINQNTCLLSIRCPDRC